MPASESSVKPINISSVSKKLNSYFAPGVVEILLRVRAANWLSFYWLRMCCRMPIKMLSSWLFLENRIRASALTSVIKDRISSACSLTSTVISADIMIFRNTETRSLTWTIIFSSFSSMSPLSKSSEPSTSSTLSSRTASSI